MSNVLISRAIENIRSNINIYTPLVEVIVNAIQSIEQANNSNGKISIEVIRSSQETLENSESEVEGFKITDNGIGFTDKNRDSFDTLYTDNKINEGGKGFGRFTCLKYFDEVIYESTYQANDHFMFRKFRMGKQTEIIINELLEKTQETHTGCQVYLKSIKNHFNDKNIEVISRILVEKLLPFFISEDKPCPQVEIFDNKIKKPILLNMYVTASEMPLIQEMPSANGNFSFEKNQKEENFKVRVFKIYSSRNKNSKVSLVAHRREVTSNSLYHYIPEFKDEFFDTVEGGDRLDRNFIIKVYVFGNYLNNNVSLERGGFEFQKENDLFSLISQKEIEEKASQFANNAVSHEVKNRQEKKAIKVNQYVKDHAPWYREVAKETDIGFYPYNPTNEQIDSVLHQSQFRNEVQTKNEVKKLLKSENLEELHETTVEVVNRISGDSKNELIHYVALRKSILDIFQRALEVNTEDKYSSEDVVHNIIFPLRKDIDSVNFDSHNLWIIDERLNFTDFLASDLPMSKSNLDRPDLLAFEQSVCFRGENEPSNPVTIFEFKKPQRDDFTNRSAKEDPVQQIIRYANSIRDGEYKTPKGREILILDNTPFYGYVICDLTPKVKKWLEREKNFKPMPDRLGYFYWHSSTNLYIEVLSWDKVLKDAVMRNKVFFRKLGIE